MNIQPFANTLRSRCAGVLSLAALVLSSATALAAACERRATRAAPATSETAAPAGTQAVIGARLPDRAGGAGGRRLPVPGRPRRLDGGRTSPRTGSRRSSSSMRSGDRPARSLRPVVHGLRGEYQDRVNFVILDFDVLSGEGAGDRSWAWEATPRSRLVAPDSAEALTKSFGPLSRADAAQSSSTDSHRQPRRVAGATGARDGVS